MHRSTFGQIQNTTQLWTVHFCARLHNPLNTILHILYRGVVSLRHLRHVPPPPHRVATLVSLQNRVKSITLCVILNANNGKIVHVTLCIQIEWLFYNAFWCETNTIVTLTPSRARGHAPTLLQMTGHGDTESKKNKKKKVIKLY